MKINSVVKHCRPETTLADAASLMWENNCGVLPVIAESNETVGIITDSDIAIALGTQKKHAKEISVKDAMFGRPFHWFSRRHPNRTRNDAKRTIQALPVLNQLDE
jgi:CBS domain-containing protein